MVENVRFGRIGNWRDGTKGEASLYNYELIDRPLILSRSFKEQNAPESENFVDGAELIRDVMRGLDSMFLHNFAEVNTEYLAEGGFREFFVNAIKNPGYLHHVVFWDFVKDPKAVLFEWFRFKNRLDLCFAMLEGQNFDIFARPCLKPVSEPWEHLAKHYEIARKSHDYFDHRRAFFTEVLGWPLS